MSDNYAILIAIFPYILVLVGVFIWLLWMMKHEEKEK